MKKVLFLLFASALSWQCSAPPAEDAAAVPVERPLVVGIANFVVMTDSIEDARMHYGHYLGYSEAFQHTRPGVEGEISVFKVNDTQFIELSPTLQREEDDKLIQIGFETENVQQLRDYLAQEGYEVLATVEKDADGNLSFRIADPEGHRVEFVEYLDGSLQHNVKGQFLTEERISDHMLHVGIHVYDEELTQLWPSGTSKETHSAGPSEFPTSISKSAIVPEGPRFACRVGSFLV